MTTEGLIAASDFCVHHQVEYTFINLLSDAGLVTICIVDEHPFIPETELSKLERLVRLHQELDINPQGIEAITHLLERMEMIQEELKAAKNKLSLYE